MFTKARELGVVDAELGVDLAVVLADRGRAPAILDRPRRAADERARVADRPPELGMLDVAPVAARGELLARDDLVDPRDGRDQQVALARRAEQLGLRLRAR